MKGLLDGFFNHYCSAFYGGGRGRGGEYNYLVGEVIILIFIILCKCSTTDDIVPSRIAKI